MRRILTLAGACVALLLTSNAWAQEGEGAGRGDRPRRNGPPPWAQNDNNNGLGRRRPGPPRWAQGQGGRQQLRARIDTNGDGQISEEERAAAREAMQQRMQNRFRDGMQERALEHFDADGDGELSEEEREAAKAAARQRVLEHFDENGDGALSGEELNKVARALMIARHRMPPGQRPRRPGVRDGGEGEGVGNDRQAPRPWANNGGRDRGQGRPRHRQGPPPWANDGGNSGGNNGNGPAAY